MNTIAARTTLAVVLGIIAGCAYGLITRLVFTPGMSSVWSTMSCTFLLAAPFVMGFITVAIAPPSARSNRGYALFAPWLSCVALFGVVMFFALEAAICIVMAAPVFLGLSTTGGLIAFALFRKQDAKRSPVTLAVLILPYLLSPLESQLPEPNAIRLVHTEIVIDAPESSVWANIARVARIQANEQSFSLLHLIGLPKPVEATLSFDGVGGVRHASFDNGLTFIETVDAWQPNKHIAFSIKPDMPTTSNPFNAIGGRYFDVLDGSYTIERVPGGKIKLSLDSHERITTRFNVYGGWWTDLIMRDLQNYILQIVKVRSERTGDHLLTS